MRQLIMRNIYLNVASLTRQRAEEYIKNYLEMIEDDKFHLPDNIKENYYIYDTVIPSDKNKIEVIYPVKERDVIPQFMTDEERERIIQETLTYPMDKLDKLDKDELNELKNKYKEPVIDQDKVLSMPLRRALTPAPWRNKNDKK